MVKTHCALCDKQISHTNQSREHIFPQAIGGGNKVVKNFLCKACNNNSGNTWDAELAKQLKPWCLLFNVKRARGSVQPLKIQKLSGSQVLAHPEGYGTPSAPSWKQTDSGLKVEAAHIKFVRQQTQKLQNQYPDTPWDKVESHITQSSEPVCEVWDLNVNLGGPGANRSIVKSALALTVLAGVSVEACEVARAYLQCADSLCCLDYYFGPDIVIDRQVGDPLHCICIKGCPKHNTIVAYIEIFGHYRMVACLSRNYTGELLEKNFAVNPITGREVPIKINWPKEMYGTLPPYTPEDVFKWFLEAKVPIVKAGQRMWHDRAMFQVVKNAVDDAFRTLDRNVSECMTEEQVQQFARHIADQVWPFISYRLICEEADVISLYAHMLYQYHNDNSQSQGCDDLAEQP